MSACVELKTRETPRETAMRAYEMSAAAGLDAALGQVLADLVRWVNTAR